MEKVKLPFLHFRMFGGASVPIAKWQKAGQLAGFFGETKAIQQFKQAHLEDVLAELEDQIGYGNFDLEVDLGFTQHLLGERQKAIKQLEAAENKTDAAHYQLGRTLFEQMEDKTEELSSEISWTSVVDNLKKALSYDANNMPARYFLGKAILNLIQEESLKTVMEQYQAYLNAQVPIEHRQEVQNFLLSQDENEQIKVAFELGKEALQKGELQKKHQGF